MSSPDAVLDKSDPGDDVAARFDYQHCYAAINAIRLITDSANAVELICENHEDFLIRTPLSKFVGTQIKTRAHTKAPFKASDEQVKHALGKFCVLDVKFPGAFDRFDLTTNHLFWEEQETQNNLPWLLKTLKERDGIKGLRATSPLRAFVEGVATECGSKPASVAATFRKLSLRGHGQEVAHIRSDVLTALSECPGMKEVPFGTVSEIAAAIIDLARNASIKKLKGPITELYAPGTDLAQAVDDQVLAGKRINKAEVLAIIDKFKTNATPYQDLPLATLITPSDVPSDLVTAMRKFARGQLESGRVTNIEDRVRSLEFQFIEWTRRFGTEEAAKRYNNILAAVQHEAAEAQAVAQKAGEPFASEMYKVLGERLQARAKNDADQLYNSRPELLIGAAGVLTQSCKVWWSSKFDVNGEVK